MQITIKNYFGVLVAPLFMLGCGGDDDVVRSSSLPTGQFWVSYSIIDDGSDKIYAEAQLTKGALPTEDSEDDFYIDLKGKDSLWLANGEDGLQDLNIEENLFVAAEYHQDKYARFRSANDVRDSWYIRYGTYYFSIFDRPTQAETSYNITLFRGDDDAFKSTVEMPEPFELLVPSSGSSFNRESDRVEVVWNNVSGVDYQVHITATTVCLDNRFDEFTYIASIDTGSYTFAPGALDSPILDGNCSTTIAIAKLRFGDIDPIFSGGLIQAQQVRRLTLSSLGSSQ